MEKKQESKLHCRVVLFPQSYTGHLTPMLSLGHALHSEGFSITVIHTRFNSPDPIEYPNFNFRFIEDVLSKAKTSSKGSLDTLTVLNNTCLEPFRDCLTQVMEDASKDQEPVACLISDPMWVFPGLVADQLNLPRLTLRTGGLLAFILYNSLSLLQEKGYFPIQEPQMNEPVLEVPPLKVKDLPTEAHHHVLLGMAKETKRNCQGIICNTFKELELQGSILDRFCENFPASPTFLIGPLHKKTQISINTVSQDQSSIMWLNRQAPNSVLYISFGTLAAISKEQLSEIAWGLADSQQPFLWVIQPRLIDSFENNNMFSQDFLESVSEKGHIVEWVPQQEVLAHPAVGGFWTHCGWNSTMESICEAVPMICLPFFGDQMMNARHISDVLKIGLQFEKGLERREIKKVIRRLMVEKEGQEMRERITSLKEKADRSLMKGESSYESLNQLTNHILSFCGAEKKRI